MDRRLAVVVLILAIAGLIFSSSFAVLNHFYGEGVVTSTTQNVVIENFGETVTIDNVSYDVENVQLQENSYTLEIARKETVTATMENYAPAPAGWATGDTKTYNVSQEAYEEAQETGGPVTVSTTTVTEIKPIDVVPIAASIGIAAGIVAVSIWVGYRQSWGDATSALLEHGLHDMSVRDVELVGYIMQKGEFTIPELMKLTKASKLKVWRTVQKLIDQGLVEQTEQTKPAANGLGGRGKPSHIYRYVKTKPPTKETLKFKVTPPPEER